ncbi:UDP-glucose 4-epimerase GalE [Candidatus Woesebacteria bacterium RIFCSPLOWO2_01_FULL_39_10]|uniref:UDP-glucose 4-epimerase n=1 Tax=Candidatus Woesebacteria bacterium RIFCSPLOWO2_01_FULL_39_10 TaxID=1802516 RepID=A0A1F8B9M5_9BACT|nr:MAG: UDP-glucose 4-epimerase GalE [Candidatus Woesebacteria bacterium RIFCSPLOWO2_01_FULL_39_10]
MKKILVTGGGGYIGSVATYLLLQNDFEVVVIDNFSTGHRKPLEFLESRFGKKKLRFYEADLKKSLGSIFKKEKGIDACIHYAASCSVNESMQVPEKYFSNNVCGSLNLISTLVRLGVCNIVFSSTCAVYGEAEYVPVDEKHPKNPANPYGASKKMVEEIIEWFGKTKNLNYMILRYFNVCGASDDGEIGDSKKPSSLLVQNAVRGALGIEPFYLTCPTVSTPDQTPIRDYINVVDLNEAHISSLEYLLKGGKSETLNLGTGSGNSVLEVLKTVEKVTDVEFDIQKTTPRLGEYAKMIADIKKVNKVLGWKPKRNLETSIRSLVLWYKKHPQGWE